MKIKSLLLATCMLVTTGFVNANPIASALPTSTYIIQNGLAWTWASPVNEQIWGSNVLSAPSFHEGWRFATNAELLDLPTLADFGFGAIQSTAYWNSVFTHVDTSDMADGSINSQWGNGSYETFYVSNLWAGAPIAAVPEPETYAMLLVGLGLVGFQLRRKSKQTSPSMLGMA